MIQPIKIVTGTVGYLLIVFPLAFVWHLVFFEATYRRLGYFSRQEPIIELGFSAILLQGILLSVVYPLLCRSPSSRKNLVTFLVVMGGYHWTVHVLAEAAKHPIEPLPTWFALVNFPKKSGRGFWLYETDILSRKVVAVRICLRRSRSSVRSHVPRIDDRAQRKANPAAIS
jgi:hypothetical protein